MRLSQNQTRHDQAQKKVQVRQQVCSSQGRKCSLEITGEDKNGFLECEAQVDQELQSILEYEQQLEAAITRTRRVLRTAVQLTSPVAPSAALGDSIHKGSISRSVSLPKLQIPKFGWKLQDRARFWEHFQATIHNNGALAPVEKYILCYVTEEARRAIDGISLSGTNYQKAVEALRQRFGGTELLAVEHIAKLLSLRAVQGSGDATHATSIIRRSLAPYEGLGIISNSAI
ncbi:uncharacterized protein LOC135392230 [Ornithodoros turicata]|uniref:uncharacterized protein LOC135392230 n=1 Tax=Ornithodoros turicata TaxID=34597 RepID=UPI00313A20DE